WLAKAVVEALAKTGVLNQYEIMKEHRKKDDADAFISRMQ
ncbi:ABC transporter ATP-binding protein, partial [Bacillus licheniformis]